jgi:hypothetical protein
MTDAPIVLTDPGGDRLVVRGPTVVARHSDGLVIADADGVRAVRVPWPVWRHELSTDGAYLLVLGDEGRRGQVIETKTGAHLLDLSGGSENRHSLRAGLVTIGGRAYVLADPRRGSLAIWSLDSTERIASVNLSGLTTFRLERIVPLAAGWVALHGSRFAEQYYTIAIVAESELLADPEALQAVLLSRPAPSWWGYETAIGPAGLSHAVIARNPEWDPDEPPEWEDEDLRGFLVWDLHAGRVVDRLRWTGAIPNGGVIGADSRCVAIERDGEVEVIDRVTGASRVLAGLALDPYRLSVATRRGAELVIAAIA